MLSDKTVEVGDYIIDCDQIHVVLTIENDIIQYEPLLKSDKNKNLQSYISFKNFKKAGIRFLMTKDEVKLFLKSFTNQPPLEFSNYNNKNNYFKECLYLNDPYKTGQLLNFFWKQHELPTYTKSDQSIFEQALKHLSDEISAVSNISFDKAQSQILTGLKNKVLTNSSQ